MLLDESRAMLRQSSRIALHENYQSDFEDYNLLKNFDPKSVRSNAVSWTDYVIGE